MIPFFFIGNRRSGTTLVCHIINKHPRLFTPFERYIMWILLHIHRHGDGNDLHAPSRGVFEPIWITLSQAGSAFLDFQRSGARLDSVREAFFAAIHNCRMAREKGKWRNDLVAIGEKNPPEYTAPGLIQFVLSALPDARFVHVVRHPAAVVQSRRDYIKRHQRFVPEFWKLGRKVGFVYWVEHEQGVLEVKKLAPVLTIRYENLCEDPLKHAAELYRFFGLSSNARIDSEIKALVGKCENDKYNLSVPHDIQGLKELMEIYGY